MDERVVIADNGKERSRRPVRNKKYNRRNFGEERRPPKRLFTPEIKRFLKGWLVRRRDNPYPNRDEKKALALQTGLTYIQVCNWFANWRRKLKNAGKEPQRKTWGYLIKTYNSQVQGNVEHFSICSDDSIWEDDSVQHHSVEIDAEQYEDFVRQNSFARENDEFLDKNLLDHCYTIEGENNNIQAQCYYISSTTENDIQEVPQQANKYKSHIMEKYLRDCQKVENTSSNNNNYEDEIAKPSIISKWRESAANFRPSEKNYLHWTLTKTQKKKKIKNNYDGGNYQQHGREELDAAETLTRLANAYNANFAINV
ncbi:homeobox protein Mohawk [Onthophagus taurus]|uniref:homeobox protein Mohawk n=1 Tax=Onthophagus taurus TaxID=166361 RepID=UPI000C206AF8|nr:homeobox protein Mohawk isoform X2 [Onthophagus taurus]